MDNKDNGVCFACDEPVENCRCRVMAVELPDRPKHFVTYPYIEEKRDV